jgi:hypothetical protein
MKMALDLHRNPKSIEDNAADALAARRRLQSATQLAQDLLPQSARSALDRVLRLPDTEVFAHRELATASALLVELKQLVAQAGGAPVTRHTEDGHPYLVGGTEASRCVQVVVEALGDLLHNAWTVGDRLAAEAAIAWNWAMLVQEAGSGRSHLPQ